MKITIDTKDVERLVKKADKVFIKPEAEEALIQLRELLELVTAADKDARARVEAKGLKLMGEDFNGIKGDRVTVVYGFGGGQSPYKIDESKLDKLPESFYEKKTKISPNTKAIRDWLKEHEALPEGVEAPERKKSVSFRVKKL